MKEDLQRITNLAKMWLLFTLATVLLGASAPSTARPIAFAATDSSAADQASGIAKNDDDNNNNNPNGDSSTVAKDAIVINAKKAPKTSWSDIEYLKDANNVTMVDYKNLFGMEIGKVYNPNFVDDADWFLSHFENHGDYYLIPYNYDWHFYSDIAAPWYGCEAQSKGMMMAIDAYEVTKDQKYRDFSEKLLNGFNSTTLNRDGWYLGVSAPNNDAAILNSQLFCVIALHGYYELTGNDVALGLFQTGVNVLEKNIDDLTAHCGTYYSLTKDRLVSQHQHPEYIGLLSKLYSITGNAILKNTLDRWEQDYSTCTK